MMEKRMMTEPYKVFKELKYLEDGFPDPNAKGLQVQVSSFLKCLVERRKLQNCIDVSVSVKN